MSSGFVPDPSRYVPIDPTLRCGEEWTSRIVQYHDYDPNDDDECEYDDGRDDYDEDDFRHPSPITFHVTLPAIRDDDNDIARRRRRPVKLNFNARDRSSGVLLPSEQTTTATTTTSGGITSSDERVDRDDDDDDDDEYVCDPFFFERGFYLEAKTGFQPWPGSRLMLEAFACSNFNDANTRMGYWRGRLIGGCGGDDADGLRILEVGAGVGLVGTCLAALGGTVLITDLAVLVEHGILPNLRRNDRRRIRRNRRKCRANAGKDDNDVHENETHPPPLLDAHDVYRIECGRAQAAVLDWSLPVSEQLPNVTSGAFDVIVACDCMWMRKLIDPLFNVIATLFERCRSNDPSFLFTYQRRNMMGVFIGMEELLERIEGRGWIVECIAWRTIAVEGDGEQDLHLFEVRPVASL
jgi:hypothetical protein